MRSPRARIAGAGPGRATAGRVGSGEVSMAGTLGAAGRRHIGARTQRACTHGWRSRSTPAPMTGPIERPIVAGVVSDESERVPWALPFFATALGALVIATAVQGDPSPAL